MPESLVGQVINDYEIIMPLTEGGMASIFLARQQAIERKVAFKVLARKLHGDPQFAARFDREVETMARLQHPHILPIYDHGEIEDMPYIVMMYVSGGTLYDLIEHGPMALQDANRIISQIAEALDFAHRHGVIHRDIKPANVLLDEDRNVYLADFGIARAVHDVASDLTADQVVGTASYLAPELIQGSAKPSPVSDTYALGVTLYNMLAGKVPFGGESSMHIMWSQVNDPVPLLEDTRTDLPPGVDAIIQKAMAKLPEARYTGAGALAADLDAVVQGKPPVEAVDSAPLYGAAYPPALAGLESAVRRVINGVVKIMTPAGGQGSGLYVEGNHILTALHVVDGEPGIYVKFRSGERIEADLMALDRGSDLALLRLRLSPQMHSPDDLSGLDTRFIPLEPGAPLAAIGHPLGLDWSVSGGHYNGLRLPGEDPLPRFGIEMDCPLVQVDVAINPGNSGGPIIDRGARLVGIADSMINPALANNIGFAIHGPTAITFFKENRHREAAYVACNDGKHHPPGTLHNPKTGKPLQALDPIPMPAPDTVLYSDGQHYPPGLKYSPQSGKPVQEAGPAFTRPAEEQTAVLTVKCSGCGFTYSASETYCPSCGKPRGKVGGS